MSKYDNEAAKRQRIARLQREALDSLHRLDAETDGRAGLMAEVINQSATAAVERMRRAWIESTGAHPPDEAQTLLDDFLADSATHAETLETVDRASKLLEAAGARTIYRHQRVKAEDSARRVEYQQANRKYSKEEYQAAVNRLHDEYPSLSWTRIKNIAANELSVNERTIHNNTRNPLKGEG